MHLARAAEILNGGKKIAILAGRGALGAADELEPLPSVSARRSSSRCSARPRVPDDSPYTTGGIGLLGTKPSQDAMESCDTLFMLGSSFPYIEFYPKPGRPRRADRHRSQRIGLRYPVEVGLVGDCAPRLASACCRCCKQKEDRSFLEKAQKGMKEWNELMEERGTRDRQADEAAGRGPRAEQASAGRCHRRLRLRHDHHLVARHLRSAAT